MYRSLRPNQLIHASVYQDCWKFEERPDLGNEDDVYLEAQRLYTWEKDILGESWLGQWLKILGTPTDIANAYRTVEALMAAHNFCIDNGDHPEDIPWFDWHDPEVDAAVELARAGLFDDVDDEYIEADDLREQGQQMREEIFNVLFPPQ